MLKIKENLKNVFLITRKKNIINTHGLSDVI